MKNPTHCILQAIKWTCSLAVILLAVSWSETALAQPVFFDTGFTSNRPPAPGPYDIYQTNALNEAGSTSGINYSTDNNPAPGVTFVTPTSGTVYAVTNVLIGTSGNISGDYGNTGGGNGTPLNNNQSYVLSFYQIAGTTTPNGISSNATLITSITSSNGLVRTAGDWMSFSNFAVFLKPGTTNAFSLGRLGSTSGNGAGLTHFNGEGWMHLPLVTNNIGAGPATHYFGTGANFYNGMTCVITNTSTVNYGVGSTINQGVPHTNASTVFDVGINTGFLPAIFLAQPFSYQVVNPGAVNATLVATGVGSSNSPYGIGGRSNWAVVPSVGAPMASATAFRAWIPSS